MIARKILLGIAGLVLGLAVAAFLILQGERERFLPGGELATCGYEAELTTLDDPTTPLPPLEVQGTPAVTTLEQLQAVQTEPLIAETQPAEVAALARRYQPTFRVAKADRFWPVSVEVLFELDAGGARRSCSPAGDARSRPRSRS